MHKQKTPWVTHSGSLLLLSKRLLHLYLKAKESKVCSLPGTVLKERVIAIPYIYLDENMERKNTSPALRIRKHIHSP